MALARTKPAKSDAVLRRLTALHPKLIDLSLDRMERLLQRLGHPERRLPRVVHVAGTNGKGSLIAYLRSMLEAAGTPTHVYISPHLVTFNERIRLAGELIDDAQLIAALEAVERHNNGDPITFFEATTAAAFLAFAETPAEVLLLETGLGGRLDATNVVARPALTAITPISLDHQDFLGDNLIAIAAEKAGILKPGVPAVIGPQVAAVAAVLESRARLIDAPLFRDAEDWRVTADAGRLHWRGDGVDLDLPLPALAGAHQVANAGTAIACLRRLEGVRVPPSAIAAGLANVEWPARLQRLRDGPLIACLRAGCGEDAELWLDGGHNPAAGEVLAACIAEWQLADRASHGAARPLVLVLGMKSNKDLGGFLAPLAAARDAAPGASRLFGLAIPEDEHCHDSAAIAAAARALGFPAAAAPSAARAVETIAGTRFALPPRVLICGSLYLAGTILAEND